jgi:hypothetical protein
MSPPPRFGTVLAIENRLVTVSSIIYSLDIHTAVSLFFWRRIGFCYALKGVWSSISRPSEPALNNVGTLLQNRIRRVCCGRRSVFICNRRWPVAGNAAFERWFRRMGTEGDGLTISHRLRRFTLIGELPRCGGCFWGCTRGITPRLLPGMEVLRGQSLRRGG